MRKCKRCDYKGLEESFPKAHEINGVMYYRHVCLGSLNPQKRTYKRGVRDEFREYKKSLMCVVCGFNDPRALTFHHRSRDEKEFTVANVGSNGKSFTALMREIEKCDVLCANCHLILHAEERDGL